MSERNRGYYRIQRAKHIKRKRKKLNSWNGSFIIDCDGKLSKGKIHCSCWMCRTKSKDRRSHADLVKIDKMDFDERNFKKENLDFS